MKKLEDTVVPRIIVRVDYSREAIISSKQLLDEVFVISGIMKVER